MYRILLPVDTSEERTRESITSIVDLPESDSAISVTVLNVFEEFDAVDDSGGYVKSEELFEDYDPPSSVDLAGDLLDENGIEWEFRVEHGEPAEVILEVADDENTDAIVMASGTRSPVGKVLFGSVTQGVLLDADRPVIVA